MQVKNIILPALLYALAAPVLFFTESYFTGYAESVVQIPYLTLIATGFFALSLLQNALMRAIRPQGQQVVTYWLSIRLSYAGITLLLFVLYATLVRQQLLLFTFNLMVYYLLQLVLSTMLYHAPKVTKHS